MPNSKTEESPNQSPASEPFGNLLAEFERDHSTKRQEGARDGTVVSVSADSVVLDVGFKTEGVLPLAELGKERETIKPGDKLQVTIKGRDPEGYYQLTRGKVVRATDWSALEKAFTEKTPIVGMVTGVVKGGLSVDVGVRAFMPASRSGTRDAAEMGKLVEQEIRCRIIKLDAADEDVVVDRRAILEEDELAVRQLRYSDLREGNTVVGTVRSLRMGDHGADMPATVACIALVLLAMVDHYLWTMPLGQLIGWVPFALIAAHDDVPKSARRATTRMNVCARKGA